MREVVGVASLLLVVATAGCLAGSTATSPTDDYEAEGTEVDVPSWIYRRNHRYNQTFNVEIHGGVHTPAKYLGPESRGNFTVHPNTTYFNISVQGEGVVVYTPPDCDDESCRFQVEDVRNLTAPIRAGVWRMDFQARGDPITAEITARHTGWFG